MKEQGTAIEDRLAFLLHWAFALTQAVFAQDAKGIKSANLKGADLKLMNNHDPVVAVGEF